MNHFHIICFSLLHGRHSTKKGMHEPGPEMPGFPQPDFPGLLKEPGNSAVITVGEQKEIPEAEDDCSMG